MIKMTAEQLREPKEGYPDEKKEIIYIKTDTILPNRAQPRTFFDENAVKELAESIKTHGIIQPLTVRKIQNKSRFSHFQYELIAGERRLRASKLLEMPQVPCIIMEIDSKTSAELAIIENLHRKDLNLFEEASAIASLIELYSLTQEQVAAKLSITQAAVANKLRILRLTQEEKALIAENGLTERHARALLKIKNKEDRLKALKHIIEKEFHVKQSEEYVDLLLKNQENTGVSPKTDENQAKTREKTMNIHTLISSIEDAVRSTRNGGNKIKTQHTETDTDIIITISIPK